LASKMFPFITCTWNPLGGECKHGCRYCWARALAEKYDMKKYQGEPRLYQRELEREFKPGDFVFVCDMLDLFGEWVGRIEILAILDVIRNTPEANFLLLTKNPRRYLEFLDIMPENAVLGCTVESDVYAPDVSAAPHPCDRFNAMAMVADIVENRLFFSVEPVLWFSEGFIDLLTRRKPWAVAIGYDNYGNHLLEPSLARTMQLIERLEKAGITVYRKTLREAWNV